MTKEQRELFAKVVRNNAEMLTTSLTTNASIVAHNDGSTVRTDEEVVELARESFRKSVLKRVLEQMDGWNIY